MAGDFDDCNGGTWDRNAAEIVRRREEYVPTEKPSDPAEGHKNVSRNAKYLHGWTVETWIKYIETHSECTLPSGVAHAIISYLKGQ